MAAAVSVSGIIGFAGLVVPHMLRLVTGPDHRRLIPVSALAGGVFLLAADTVARTILAPTELPVGVITAFLGRPSSFTCCAREKSRYDALNVQPCALNYPVLREETGVFRTGAGIKPSIYMK